MGSAIAQYYYPESPFTRRIFVNGSGRRTSEPISVVACATQSTLTELLLYLATPATTAISCSSRPVWHDANGSRSGRTRSAKGGFSSSMPPFLSQVQLQTVKQWLLPLIRRLCAAVANGRCISPRHLPPGQFTPSYILITVGLNAPLLQTLFRWLVAIAHLPAFFLFLLPLVRLADILVYIFGPWLWTVGLRYFQGRPLFARTGKANAGHWGCPLGS